MTDELAVNATLDGDDFGTPTVSVTKIAGTIQVNVRNGVMICPQCGDELVEVSRDAEGVIYESRSDKAVMDIVRRDLAAAIDSIVGKRDE